MNTYHLGLTFEPDSFCFNFKDSQIKEWFLNRKQDHDQNLAYFIDQYGNLSADKILKKVFPTPEVGIFISHSHDDVDEAKRLAYLLTTNFHQEVFIDEYIWGSADTLLREINKIAYNSDKHTYEYNQTCLNASSVYILLANAISKVIHKCKYFIFLKTENSLSSLTPGCTRSPWIYFEMQLINDIIQNEKIVIPQKGLIKESKEQIGFSELAFPIDYKSFSKFSYFLIKRYFNTKLKNSIKSLQFGGAVINTKEDFMDFYDSL